MILFPDGGVKLGDLGVAAQLDNTMSMRHTTAGTVLWMAPEQFKDEVSYDNTVDVWGAGITAYELVTGAPPFAYEKSIFKVCAHAPRASKCR